MQKQFPGFVTALLLIGVAACSGSAEGTEGCDITLDRSLVNPSPDDEVFVIAAVTHFDLSAAVKGVKSAQTYWYLDYPTGQVRAAPIAITANGTYDLPTCTSEFDFPGPHLLEAFVVPADGQLTQDGERTLSGCYVYVAWLLMNDVAPCP